MPVVARPLADVHRRRLREVWRSAGWPCRDGVEAELLAAGLLARRFDDAGRETVFVTDAGIAVLAQTLERNRAAFDAHEALVARVALEMQRAGRIVWRGLSLRAPLPARPAEAEVAPPATAPSLFFRDADSGGQVRPSAHDGQAGAAAGGSADVLPEGARRWVIAMPDVFSIRQTTVEDYAEPVVHEIKVRRADLLADLRRPDKGAAYAALSSQCWYVLARGIARADEVPPAYGVLWADERGLEVARPAPRRPMRVPFAIWMVLARADAQKAPSDTEQPLLAERP